MMGVEEVLLSGGVCLLYCEATALTFQLFSSPLSLVSIILLNC